PQILVRQVDQALVARGGMDRRHDAGTGPQTLVRDFAERRQAVGGARRVRDETVSERVVGVEVDSEDDRRIDELARCREDDLLYARRDVPGSSLTRAELARALQDDLDAGVPPRDRLRRGL